MTDLDDLLLFTISNGESSKEVMLRECQMS